MSSMEWYGLMGFRVSDADEVCKWGRDLGLG